VFILLKLKKKAISFSIDIIIAILIISFGFYMIFTEFSKVPDYKKAQSITIDTMNFLSSLNVQDICDGEISTPPHPNCNCIYDSLTGLYCIGIIKNPNQTVLELIGELYVFGREDLIEGLINEIIDKSKVIPRNYKFSFSLEFLSNQTNPLIMVYERN
jgi:hypothetical protein